MLLKEVLKRRFSLITTSSNPNLNLHRGNEIQVQRVHKLTENVNSESMNITVTNLSFEVPEAEFKEFEPPLKFKP